MDCSYCLRTGIHCLHHFRHFRHFRHFLERRVRLLFRLGIRHGFCKRLGYGLDLAVNDLSILLRQQLDVAKLQRFVVVRLLFRHGLLFGLDLQLAFVNRFDRHLQQLRHNRLDRFDLVRDYQRHPLIQWTASMPRWWRGIEAAARQNAHYQHIF